MLNIIHLNLHKSPSCWFVTYNMYNFSIFTWACESPTCDRKRTRVLTQINSHLLQTFTWKEKSYKHCTWHQNTVAIPPSRYFILHAKCVFNIIEKSISFSTNSILHLFFLKFNSVCFLHWFLSIKCMVLSKTLSSIISN